MISSECQIGWIQIRLDFLKNWGGDNYISFSLQHFPSDFLFRGLMSHFKFYGTYGIVRDISKTRSFCNALLLQMSTGQLISTRLLLFFQNQIFQKIFQEYNLSVNWNYK